MSGRGLVAMSSSDLSPLLPGRVHRSGRAALPVPRCSSAGVAGHTGACSPPAPETRAETSIFLLPRAPRLLEKSHLPPPAQRRCRPAQGQVPGLQQSPSYRLKLPGSEEPEPGTGPCERGMTKIASAPVSRRPPGAGWGLQHSYFSAEPRT